MKIAIIGSGATGYVAATTARLITPNAKIVVFHGGSNSEPHRLLGKEYQHWSRDDFSELHREIRGNTGFKFPPPKSHFGETVPKHQSNTNVTAWRSTAAGGLSRYWSASLLPFTDSEFREWGFGAGDFSDHYQWVASDIGLAAREDGLNQYFPQSFATRPPIKPTPLIEALIETIGQTENTDSPGLVAGVNRVAIETQANHKRSCTHCGGCFYGCYRSSIFDGSEALKRRSHDLEIDNVYEKATRIERTGAGFALVTPNNTYGPFDKVFCAAGCIGALELVSRNFLEESQALEFIDNELFIFPIFYIGSSVSSAQDYLAIANAIVGLLPDRSLNRYAEAHIAPTPDLLTRFYLPSALDSLAIRSARFLRNRMLLMKLYLHSDTKRRLLATPTENGVQISVSQEGEGALLLPAIMGRLKKALSKSGFWIPSIFPTIKSSTSSHYAGGLHPTAKYPADPNTGEIEPGFHILDSSLLPFSPAQPLTFTSMANARRIVQAVLND